MPLDTASLEHQLQLYKGLVEVSALINGITDRATLLPAILDVARRVLHAEVASLFLVNAEGELELVAARGGPSSTLPTRIIVPRGRGISGWVLEHGEPVLVADAYTDSRFFAAVDKESGYRTRSMICVPLGGTKAPLGVLQIMNPTERDSFNAADVEASSAYANLAATALEKLHTMERQRVQERAEREFALAREIQTSFLPLTLPQRTDLAFAAYYRPAQNVGGDFYDIIEISPEEIYFVIGDVSGKGVPAALLMAQALSTLRLIVRPGLSPDDALARWNSRLSGHTIRGMFITALLGRILPGERRVQMASAGHGAPFHVTASGSAEEIALRGAPPLGILAELPRQCYELSLPQGDLLAFFTDGLVESFDAARVPLGHGGVRALLQQPFQSAQAMVDRLCLGELAHRQAAEPSDDLTLLAFGFR